MNDTQDRGIKQAFIVMSAPVGRTDQGISIREDVILQSTWHTLALCHGLGHLRVEVAKYEILPYVGHKVALTKRWH